MADPLTGFIELTDQFGTRVSELAVKFNGGVSSILWRSGAEFVIALVQYVLVFSIFILDLIINQGLFVEIAGSVYQVVLDYIYKYVNPLMIATVAFVFLLARMYIGDKVTKDKKTGRITGYEMNDQTFADESFRKKVGKQLGNTFLLMMVIVVAMANPFLLLSKAFELINQFVSAIAPGGVGASPQIDGILVPVLQLVNFKSQLTPACTQLWSSALANGGDVTKLACLTADQKDATTANVTTFLVSLFSITIVIGFAYFAWVILCRFTWMLYRMIIHIAVLPWRSAMLIANPGSERQKLDTVKDHLLEAGKSLFWLLVTVFAAQVIPAAVLNAMSAVDAQLVQLPPVVQLPIASGLLFGAGKLVNHYVGRKWERKQDGSKVEFTDGTTGWRDFMTKGAGKDVKDAYEKAKVDSAAEIALTTAMITGAHSATAATAQTSTQGGTSVGLSAATDPDLDEATAQVNLTPPQKTVVLPVSTDSASGSVISAADSDVESALAAGAPQSATDYAAAATATVLAEADRIEPHHESAGTPGGALTTAGAGAAALGALLAAPALTSADESAIDGNGRHRRADDGDSPATGFGGNRSEVTAAEGLVAKGRELKNEYRENIGKVAEEPDTTAAVSVATGANVSSESRVFDRISKVYNESVAGPDGSPAGSGVTGGSGGFVSWTQRHVEWQEKRLLARVLGMTPEPVADEGEGKRPGITFYSSSVSGDNQVKFRGKDGFGDEI